MSKSAIPTKTEIFFELIDKIIIKVKCMTVFKREQVFLKKLLTRKLRVRVFINKKEYFITCRNGHVE